jgi:hypothetical protein
MNRVRDILVPASLLVWAALVSGCPGSVAPPPRSGPPAPHGDPCADRLHDVCGQLLLYYARYEELPQRLEDLSKVGPAAVPLVCPATRQPYVYDPAGIQVADWPGRLILYDAQPCHAGLRWGILMETPQPGKPLVVRVVHPPETAFAASRPA